MPFKLPRDVLVGWDKSRQKSIEIKKNIHKLKKNN